MNGDQDQQKRCRIKICGITNVADATAAAAAGADYLGFIFIPASRRYLAPEAAVALWPSLPAGVGRVGVFQNASADTVRSVVESTPVDVLQFHGDESAEFCAQFGKPYWKVVAMTGPDVFAAAASEHTHAEALMLDAVHVGADGTVTSGGTGQRFDADWWPAVDGQNKPLVLAGGLDPDNVAAAVMTLRPWCVDVSSGVSQSSGPGAGVAKDADLMNRFCSEVHNGRR